MSLGGNDMPDHMRRMLCAWFTDEVSQKFTFYGYGPSPKRPVAKLALRKTHLMQFIFGNTVSFFVANGELNWCVLLQMPANISVVVHQ